MGTNSKEIKAYFIYESRVKRSKPKFDRKQLLQELFKLESLKELQPQQLQILLADMRGTIYILNVKENRQRRKVIALFCQMEYVSNKKADMVRINDWCIKYGHRHVDLSNYYGADLTALVSQVEKVYASFIKGAFKCN